MKILFLAIFAMFTVLAASGYHRRTRLRRCLPSQPNRRVQATSDHLATICIIAATAAILLSAWFSRSATTAIEPETAVFFLLDSSASMLAESLSTSRLDEAKSAIAAMLTDLPELPAALVTFAGNAMLDFPPSLDHDNFRRALDAVAPAAGFVAGSAPSTALRLAEDTARAINAKSILVLLSDGEINTADTVRENTLWADRQSPLLIVITGIPGAAKQMPTDNGWVIDPDTGAAALSTATDRDLVRLAKLSEAPWRLAEDASPTTCRRQLPRLLAASDASAITHQHHVRTMLLIAMLLLTAWVFLKRGVLSQNRRKASSRLRAAVALLSLAIIATAQTAAPPSDDTDAIRNQLQQPGLPSSERARLLANWAALLCREPSEQIDPLQTRQHAVDAIALCREALRLSPGYPPAITNLVAARQRLERLPKDQQIATQTTAAQNPSTETKLSTEPKPMPQPAQPALTQPPTQPAPASDATGLQPAEEAPTPADAVSPSRLSSGSWRDLQTRQHAIPPRIPGVKPW